MPPGSPGTPPRSPGAAPSPRRGSSSAGQSPSAPPSVPRGSSPVPGRSGAATACRGSPPVGEEFLEGLLERERPRLILYDRQELHPEGNLHLGELVEVVQNHLGDGVLLQLDHHPRPVPVALVAPGGELLDLPVPGQPPR